MNKYVIVIVFEQAEREVTVTAGSEKAAYKLVWDSMTDGEKDNAECMDCIDVLPGA